MSLSPEIEIGKQYGNLYTTSRNRTQASEDHGYAWWDSFAKGIIGLTTFGASITFSVILSDLPDPIPIRATQTSALSRKIHFDRENVRKFLSLAWLMFVLALGFAIVSLVKLKKGFVVGNGMRFFEIVLEWLVLAAFMVLALAITAYVPEVGIAGVSFLAFFALILFAMWLGSCGN